MTLIITLHAKNQMVQASDRRLTMNGKLHDDYASKAVCVTCKDAQFVIGYTGLAQIDKKRTDEWLVDFLSDIRAGQMGLVGVHESLLSEASSIFPRLPLQQEYKGITLAFAGFRQDTPFFAHISNLEDEQGNTTGRVSSTFASGWYLKRDEQPKKKVDVVIHGAEVVVADTIRRRINSLRRHLFSSSAYEVARTLVTLIRAAARHPMYGHLIGRNCMSVALPSAGGFHAEYHPDAAASYAYLPNLVGEDSSFKDIIIWNGQGEPPPHSAWQSGKDILS